MVIQRSFFKVGSKNQQLCTLISLISMLTVEYFGRMLSSKTNVIERILWLVNHT